MMTSLRELLEQKRTEFLSFIEPLAPKDVLHAGIITLVRNMSADEFILQIKDKLLPKENALDEALNAMMKDYGMDVNALSPEQRQQIKNKLTAFCIIAKRV